MKIGDRVYIIGREHPWKWSAGTIRSSFAGSRLVYAGGQTWEVELDAGSYHGHRVAVAEDELRVMETAA